MFRVKVKSGVNYADSEGYIVGFAAANSPGGDAQVLVALSEGQLETFHPNELRVTNLELFDFDDDEEDFS